MILTVNYHRDPGHGWLEVDREFIDALKIGPHITDFSYVSKDGMTLFLEEDCDATLFVNTAKERRWAIQFAPIDTNEDSFIRKLPAYKGGLNLRDRK